MIQKFNVIFDNVVENKVKNCINKQKIVSPNKVDGAKSLVGTAAGGYRLIDCLRSFILHTFRSDNMAMYGNFCFDTGIKTCICVRNL